MGGKQAEYASHLTEPRGALSSPSSPSERSVGAAPCGRRCVDASGYSQPPSLIGVIHVRVEWLEPLRAREKARERRERRDSRRDPQA